MIDMVIENQTLRIATGVLNEIMTEAVAMQQPPSDKGKRLKLYYITQVAVKPPTFVIFVNDKELMHFSYTRYLENKIREAFGFRGTSLKFFIRERILRFINAFAADFTCNQLHHRVDYLLHTCPPFWLYFFSECIRMLRVKLLVCPHHGDEIICVGKIDYIVRIARKHMHRLDLLSAYLKV